MTDDDTKFERARRESPRRWEAVVRRDEGVPLPVGRPVGRRRRSFREIITGWGDVDREYGVPRDGP